MTANYDAETARLNLCRLMNAAGITPAALAKLVGRSRSLVTHHADGSVPMPRWWCDKYAAALNVDVSEFHQPPSAVVVDLSTLADIINGRVTS